MSKIFNIIYYLFIVNNRNIKAHLRRNVNVLRPWDQAENKNLCIQIWTELIQHFMYEPRVFRWKRLSVLYFAMRSLSACVEGSNTSWDNTFCDSQILILFVSVSFMFVKYQNVHLIYLKNKTIYIANNNKFYITFIF